MAANTFGNHFRVSTFGESHGPALGGVIDGCPAGIELNLELIQKELDRRKPGQSKILLNAKNLILLNFYPEYLKVKLLVPQ